MRFHIHSLLLIVGGVMFAIFLAGCEEKAFFQQPAARQPVHALTIVALGDSLTEGYGVAEHQAYPALLEAMLKKEGFSGTIVNAGISGETSSGLLSRIPWVLSLKPDIVILCTGANDGLQGIDHGLIQDNISQMVRKFKEHRTTVVLAGMKMLVNYGPSYTIPYARLYAEIADQEEILLSSVYIGRRCRKAGAQSDGRHPSQCQRLQNHCIRCLSACFKGHSSKAGPITTLWNHGGCHCILARTIQFFS